MAIVGVSLTCTAVTANSATAAPRSASAPVWARLNPLHGPLARSESASAYDPATRQLVMFGGYRSGSEPVVGDTWAWSGSDWTQLHPTTSPAPRAGATMAYDPSTDQLVLFGGIGGSSRPFGSYSDTWLWTGSDWIQLHPPTTPVGGAMAFDPATDQLLMFGDGPSSTSTWEWTGTTWQQHFPATSPSGAGSIDFDQSTAQLVLFADGSGVSSGSTWTWAGSTWQQIDAGTGPSALDVMAFDPWGV